MSLLKAITDNVASLWDEAKALRRLLREQGRRDEAFELRLAQLERAGGEDLTGDPIRGFAAVGDVVHLIITGQAPASIGAAFWVGRRIMHVFDDVLLVEGWRVDDQDTKDYVVLAAGGCNAPFVGARGQAFLSHRRTTQAAVTHGIWLMFAGEGSGFFGRTTGPPTSTAGQNPNAYPWAQMGSSVMDNHNSARTIELGGGLTPLPALGDATLLSSTAYPMTPWIAHDELPVNTPIHLWFDDIAGGGFVFEVAQPMQTEACPPP